MTATIIKIKLIENYDENDKIVALNPTLSLVKFFVSIAKAAKLIGATRPNITGIQLGYSAILTSVEVKSFMQIAREQSNILTKPMK